MNCYIKDMVLIDSEQQICKNHTDKINQLECDA